MPSRSIPSVLACIAVSIAPARVILAEEAASDSEAIRRLHVEVESLQQQIQELREQIAALSATAAPAPPERTAALPEPPPVPPPASSSTPTVRDPKLFNPAISAVFQAIGRNSVEHDREEEDSFSLSEAEIGLQAVVDPYAKVDLFLTFNSEGEAEVEEGHGTLQALPGGLQIKGGRFKNAMGRWNTLHDHRFPTVDQPNVLTNFFGEESLRTDGASISWLVPGTGSVYLETISEIGSTDNDVSFNADGSDLFVLQHVTSTFNVTPNATIDVGVSGSHGQAGPTGSLLEDIEEAGLTGTLEPDEHLASSVFGAEIRYKWKPIRFSLYRSVTLQAEGFMTNRRVEKLTAGGDLERETLRSAGGYGYGEYQFAKRWRAGIRFDASQFPDSEAARERAALAVLKFTPTEFQEFRIQFKHTGRNEAAASLFDDIESDNEIFIEWIPVIGTHPAHEY